MKPTGGIFMIAHLLIIVIGAVSKAVGKVFVVLSLKRTPKTRGFITKELYNNDNRLEKYYSVGIAALISSVVLFSVFSVVRGALSNGSNVDLYHNLLPTCQPYVQPISDKKVIIRIDDIQAYAWRQIQLRMMNDAFSQHIPLVVGVIPYQVEQDKAIYNFLEENRCNLEIAQHGWDHSAATHGTVPEFGNLNSQDAYAKIMQGKPILEKLAAEPLTTFIPPNNRYSPGTTEATIKAGFKAISAEGDKRFDYDATTFDSVKKVLVPIDEVMSDCQSAFADDNTCIVLLHPQDYLTNNVFDPAKYQHYLVLLNTLKSQNVAFTTIKGIIADTATPQSVPGPIALTADNDNDGLNNFTEQLYLTDPNNPDTDGDGVLDGEEVKTGFNPIGNGKLSLTTFPAGINQEILGSDNDHDELSYLQELIYGTDPNNPDTDGDGYNDKEELTNGYNPEGKGVN